MHIPKIDVISSFSFQRERIEILKSPEVVTLIQGFQSFMNNLAILTGRPILQPLHMNQIYQVFQAEVAMNLSLPDWAHDMYPRGQLLNGTLFSYDVESFNDELRMLHGGKILDEVDLCQKIFISEVLSHAI